MLRLVTLVGANDGQVTDAIAKQLGQSTQVCSAKYTKLYTRTLKPGMSMDEMKRVAFDYTRRGFIAEINGELDRLRQYAITDEQVDEIKVARTGSLRLEADAKRAIQAKLAVRATPLELQSAEKEWPTPYVCVVVIEVLGAKYYKIKAEEFPWTPGQMRNVELYARHSLKEYLWSKAKLFTTHGQFYINSVFPCVDGCTLVLLT
jgi:hypothetical protein